MSTAAIFALVGGGCVAVVAVLVFAIRMAGMAADEAALQFRLEQMEHQMRRLAEDDKLEDAAFRHEISVLREELKHVRRRYLDRARPGDGLAALRLLSRGETVDVPND